MCRECGGRGCCRSNAVREIEEGACVCQVPWPSGINSAREWFQTAARGVCLGVLVTRRRDTHAARKFLRRLLKSQEYTPRRVLITDKLRSYGAAKREVMASVEHRQSKYLNNRAENSHQRTRLREYAMRRFASPVHASRFCAVHDPIYQHFRAPQHQLDAAAHRAILPRPPHHLEPDHRRPAHPGRGRGCGLKPARDRHSRTSQDASCPKPDQQPDNAAVREQNGGEFPRRPVCGERTRSV